MKTQNQQEQVNLNFSDLELMVTILDAVTQRGAIKANEMATVGGLYEKLSTWVQAHREELARQQEEKAKLEVEDSEGDNDA